MHWIAEQNLLLTCYVPSASVLLHHLHALCTQQIQACSRPAGFVVQLYYSCLVLCCRGGCIR